MPATKYTAVFLLVLLATVLVNLAVQERVAILISPNWSAARATSETNQIANPLLERQAELSRDGIDLLMPSSVMLYATNPPTRFSLFSMLPKDAFENKIDVLFVGDSTLMWGFDHRQVANNSSLRTAQISFGQNVPDADLAHFTKLLAQCVMSSDGVVVLSYSLKALGGQRPNRPVDHDVRNSTHLNTCADLAAAMQERVPEQPNPWTDVAAYKATVLNGLVASLDERIPFWSARIGWRNIFPPRKGAIRRSFLVWQEGLKIPWQGDFDRWKFRQFDSEGASAAWVDEELAYTDSYRRVSKRRMGAWSESYIGRTVCHVMPPTTLNDDYRFGVWRDWTQSRCLLVFGSIVKDQLDVAELKMMDNHHYGEESGLVMAAAVGKMLAAEWQVIVANRADGSPQANEASAAANAASGAPVQVAPGVWLR